MLLDYSHTYPSSNICYHARNMKLHVESDAAHLVMPVYRSWITRHYYFIDHQTNPTNPSDVKPNGPIITKYKTLRHLVGYAAEADIGGRFIHG